MKKTSILRKLFVMIFTFITIAGFAQINANGGFESWTNGLPDGWKGNKSNISATNIVQVTDAHTGNYACMLKTVSSNKRFTTQPMTIVANQQYTMIILDYFLLDYCRWLLDLLYHIFLHFFFG